MPCIGIDWPKKNRPAQREIGCLILPKIVNAWKELLLCCRELHRRESRTTRTPAILWQFAISTPRTSSVQFNTERLPKTKPDAWLMTFGVLIRACQLSSRNG